MEESHSLEVINRLADQEISRHLFNGNANYCNLNKQPMDPVLYHFNSAHTITHHSFKIHFNIILPSKFRSPKWCLLSMVPD
jgi:hypothetical protein